MPQHGLDGNSNPTAFLGGSDARIIMGTDEAALLRLGLEKRGEIRLSVSRHLFTGPQPVRLPETDTGAPSIFIDELDAGGFQGAANGQVVWCSH